MREVAARPHRRAIDTLIDEPIAANEREEEPGAPSSDNGRRHVHHLQRPCDARHGLPDQPEQSGLVRCAAPHETPSFDNEYGDDGKFYSSVRQSRLGVSTQTPTALGDLKTLIEFELFGVGDDAGQTTFRLRHAWGELGQFGAGQYWSAFMDIDVFPNSIEYWGPNAMVFYRNVQARWTPWKNDSGLPLRDFPGAPRRQRRRKRARQHHRPREQYRTRLRAAGPGRALPPRR
jgi:hypothetical protein